MDIDADQYFFAREIVHLNVWLCLLRTLLDEGRSESFYLQLATAQRMYERPYQRSLGTAHAWHAVRELVQRKGSELLQDLLKGLEEHLLEGAEAGHRAVVAAAMQAKSATANDALLQFLCASRSATMAWVSFFQTLADGKPEDEVQDAASQARKGQLDVHDSWNTAALMMGCTAWSERELDMKVWDEATEEAQKDKDLFEEISGVLSHRYPPLVRNPMEERYSLACDRSFMLLVRRCLDVVPLQEEPIEMLLVAFDDARRVLMEYTLPAAMEYLKVISVLQDNVREVLRKYPDGGKACKNKNTDDTWSPLGSSCVSEGGSEDAETRVPSKMSFCTNQS